MIAGFISFFKEYTELEICQLTVIATTGLKVSYVRVVSLDVRTEEKKI